MIVKTGTEFLRKAQAWLKVREIAIGEAGG